MKIIEAIKNKGIGKKMLVLGGVILAGLTVAAIARPKNETIDELELLEEEVAAGEDFDETPVEE